MSCQATKLLVIRQTGNNNLRYELEITEASLVPFGVEVTVLGEIEALVMKNESIKETDMVAMGKLDLCSVVLDGEAYHVMAKSHRQAIEDTIEDVVTGDDCPSSVAVNMICSWADVIGLENYHTPKTGRR